MITRDDARLRMVLRWLPRIPADAAWVLGVIIIAALFIFVESWWPR